METNADSAIWLATPPASWPTAPAQMTVTTLSQIESCPRQWALSAADYPELWNERGYPPRFHLSALVGTVVHLALETITRALIRARCPSLQDATAIQVMKDLGGFTKVVNDIIDRALADLASSPRARRSLEFATRSLRAKVPELRTRVHTMLCRVRLPPPSPYPAARCVHTERRPLTTGVFSEVDLRAKQLGWKGRADLLVLSPDECEIIDFKTGAPDDRHRFQIQVYALLWSRDADLNPDRKRATRLVLAYDSSDVEVHAPNDSELEVLETHLGTRRDAAYLAVSQHPPQARPQPDSCQYCSVRHLCGEYWTPETQRQMAQDCDEQRFVDVEVTITGLRGPSSWDGRVELSRGTATGKAAVIRKHGNLNLAGR